jgi:Undecaprenyl-phosphate galactose phosphotransferase WbaP
MENCSEILHTIPKKNFVNPIASWVRRNGRAWMVFVLILSDTCCVFLAGLAAVIIRNLLKQEVDPLLYISLTPAIALFPFVFNIRDLYPAHGLGPVEELRRLVINISLVFIIFITFTFFTHTPQLYSRLTISFAWILAVVFVPVGRKLTRNACVWLRAWGEPVVILGSERGVRDLCALLKKSPNAGFIPLELSDLNGCALKCANVKSHRCADCLVNYARIAFVVQSELNQLEAIREKFRGSFERVVLVTVTDNGQNLSRVEVRDFMYFKGLEVHQTLLDRSAQVQKRTIDLLVSGVGLLALAPLFLILSAWIRLDSRGRIFYRQRRVGKDGKIFNLLKFRTMHEHADTILESVLQKDPAKRLEWEQYQKLRNDPRITRVGAWLRLFSLDELPQLWNIFKGEMSLVGPRPIMVNQQEMYGNLLNFYHQVTPGLTGQWQISGRNQATFAQRVDLDVQYIKDWSLWLDIYILTRTFWVVLNRSGAY